MGRIMRILVIAMVLSLNVTAQELPADTLTLNMAIGRALEYNPEILALKKKIEASKARLLQSGLFPNPELGLEAENIFGNNDFAGFRGSEITATVSQEISLGSTISKRVEVSKINVELMQMDYLIKRLEIISEIRLSFIDLVALSKLIEKNSELLSLSTEFVNNLQLRVNAGKISPAEVSRSLLILNSIELNINGLKSEYNSVLNKLATLLNLDSFGNIVIKKESDLLNIISESRLQNIELKSNPKLKKLKLEIQKQNAVINLEKARAIPPINLFVGVRRINEIKTNTFLVGTSIPLPIFDRNQGIIEASQVEMENLEKEYEALENNLKQRLRSYILNLKTLFKSAEKLKSESLPIAEEAYKIIKQGNDVGRFTILDVLDAQRTLIEIENQYLNIVRNANKIIVAIETITNTKI